MRRPPERQGELRPLAELLGKPDRPAGVAEPPERRLARMWAETLGDDIARNSQARYLRGTRLVVATSSAVWAQTLQFMAEEVMARLNEALGEQVIKQIVFRPAGWDPGGGAGGPPALAGGRPAQPSVENDLPDPPCDEKSLESGPGGLRRPGRGRRLTEQEKAAVEEVGSLACDEDLGRRIAGAMRAYLKRQPRG